jgi:hypothetical protein
MNATELSCDISSGFSGNLRGWLGGHLGREKRRATVESSPLQATFILNFCEISSKYNFPYRILHKSLKKHTRRHLPPPSSLYSLPPVLP